MWERQMLPAGCDDLWAIVCQALLRVWDLASGETKTSLRAIVTIRKTHTEVTKVRQGRQGF